MKPEQILQLLDIQDERDVQRIHEDLTGTMTNEFVMTNVLKGYIDYLGKSKEADWRMYEDDFKELLSQHDVLIKKTNGYEISKHNSDFAMYLHKHTYFELDYVYQGSCDYYINDLEHVFTLKEKELCLINQNVIHGIATKSKADIVFKCFIPMNRIDLDFVKELESSRSIKAFFEHSIMEQEQYIAYLVMDTKSNENLEKVMFQMFSEALEKRQGWKLWFQNYMSLLLLELTRIKEEDCRLFADVMDNDLVMDKIIGCIRKNFQYITLKDLASDFHFNENYLSRKIKRSTNMNFNELLSQCRLEEAKKQLVNTDLTVGEIAGYIGYKKPTYFYKLFKEHYGITPMEYKKKYVSSN